MVKLSGWNTPTAGDARTQLSSEAAEKEMRRRKRKGLTPATNLAVQAPTVTIDGDVYGRVKPEQLPELLARYA